MDISRLLITFGIALVVAGLSRWLSKLGIGRLPGGIVLERGNVRIYVPIMTSLPASIVLSLFAWLLNR